ncbi:MAG: rod-binding protein [Pseudomonadota bacterium]
MQPFQAIGNIDPSPRGEVDRPVAPGADYRGKATQAAVQFEGFFILHMLREMRAGTREMAGEDSVFRDPINQDMQDMADTMVADKLAGQRAFGIADAILRQLLPAPASAAHAAPAEKSK